MTILVIEDDEVWQLKIRMMLGELDAKIIMADSIAAAKHQLETSTPSLVVADVVLPDGASFDLFIGVRRSYPILFVTNYPKDLYLNKALDLDNSHFIVKPFHPLTFQGVIRRFFSNQSPPDTRPNPPTQEVGIHVWGKYRQKILLPFHQIVYIKSDRNYTEIYTKERSFTQKRALLEVRKDLNQQFIQIHRSYVVNLDFVQRIDSDRKVVISGEALPLGRSYQNHFFEKLTRVKGG